MVVRKMKRQQKESYCWLPWPKCACLLFLAVCLVRNVHAVQKGKMTMWTTNHPGDLQGSSCEYAQSASTANGAKWLEPYANRKMYCAVDSALFADGSGCGKCFKIRYNGIGGTGEPGARAGTATIQVVNSGSSEKFDCQVTAFQKITGVTTGNYPISYRRVNCKSPIPTVVVLDGNNAYYTKIMVAGGTTGVKSVKMFLKKKGYLMSRVSGATFKASLPGTTSNGFKQNPAKFEVTWVDGTKTVIKGCFNGVWPVATSKQCS